MNNIREYIEFDEAKKLIERGAEIRIEGADNLDRLMEVNVYRIRDGNLQWNAGSDEFSKSTYDSFSEAVANKKTSKLRFLIERMGDDE